MINKDLYDKIILFIGDEELEYRPYFTVDEIQIPDYSPQEVYDHLALMVEGGILDGLFASSDESKHCGYLIGGLTTETEYYYNQLKKKLSSSSNN